MEGLSVAAFTYQPSPKEEHHRVIKGTRVNYKAQRKLNLSIGLDHRMEPWGIHTKSRPVRESTGEPKPLSRPHKGCNRLASATRNSPASIRRRRCRQPRGRAESMAEKKGLS